MGERLVLFVPLIAFLIALPLFWIGLERDPGELPSALLGKEFPDFLLPDLENPTVLRDIDDISGKVTVVNVWATWCHACSLEHPLLNRLAKKGINIVGLNYKDNRSAAQEWLENRGDPFSFSIFDETGGLGLDLGVYGAPETYLMDAEGVIVHRRVGIIDEFIWQKEFKKLYQALMAGSKEK